MTQAIRSVAVLGAGTMGSGIAAQAANAGLRVLLLDVAPQQLSDEEQRRGLTLAAPEVRSRLVRAGFERLQHSRPPALVSPELARRIRLGTIDDDLHLVGEVDWVVEAIVERLEPKRALLARLEALVRPSTIISTNTSGLPIAAIAEGRSAAFQSRFLGAHFFNPPRYTHLLELIPTPATAPEVTHILRAFAEAQLGKGVVVARDEPGFIANRIGTFVLFQTLRYALDHGYRSEEVDALTGPLIGLPSTATLRLLDLVGVDVAALVAKNLHASLPADEREHFAPLAPIEGLITRGSLGNKSGGGFYKMQRGPGGSKEFWPLDLHSLDYRPAQPLQSALIEQARRISDLPTRLRMLLEHSPDDRACAFVAGTLLPSMAYAAACAPVVAENLRDVDRAMEWGYNWQHGPLAIWSALGLEFVARHMQRLEIALPPWVEQLLGSAVDGFYQQHEGRTHAAYDPHEAAWQALPPPDPRALVLSELHAAGRILEQVPTASLLDLGDGVLGLEVHSKANSLDLHTLALARRALALLDAGGWHGIVIGNQGEGFSAGANLHLLTEHGGDAARAEALVREMQQLTQALRFSQLPVVAAVHGRCLGGGTELALACARRVALAESYIGLPELGVGLIPAGGGCKEMLRRCLGPHIGGDVDPMAFVQPIFETIGLAKISDSAQQARSLGFLASDDLIVFNRDWLLGTAKQAVLDMSPGYTSPDPVEARVYAVGRRGVAALTSAIHNMERGGRISAYDALLARKLAFVLCGGDLSLPQWVPEHYLLDLERAAFVALLGDERTQARIAHTLKTGKPLRN